MSATERISRLLVFAAIIMVLVLVFDIFIWETEPVLPELGTLGSVRVIMGLVIAPLGILVSAIIIWRVPGNLVGLWLLLWNMGIIGYQYSYDLGSAQETSMAFLTFRILFGSIFLPAFSFLFYYFPTGKVHPRSLRWFPPFFILISLIGSVLTTMSQDAASVRTALNPYFVPSLSTYKRTLEYLFNPGAVGFSVILTFAIGTWSIWSRFRQAAIIERQQIKWLAFGGFLMFIDIILMFVVVRTGLKFGDFYPLIVLAGILPSLAVGLSIVRYRLYDIDFIINKSLVYGALSGLLVLILGGSLYAVAQLVQGSGSNVPAIVVAAIAFGAVFQPARYRLQRFVDRRFYHIEIDYQKADKTRTFDPTGQPDTHFGEYYGMQKIGEGGMAQVYKAQHPKWDQPVALKVLPGRLAEDATFITRFQREAHTITSLKHPNIVQIYEYGEVEGIHYMTMELLSGPDLSAYLKSQGVLSWPEVKKLISDVAAALEYAHGRGLVHRDIKPSNVMLDSGNGNPQRTVLMDFGIAKLLDKTVITKTGGVLGSFDYIAPEQIQSPGGVDSRADIYSLGILTYHLLTGKLPFPSGNPAATLIAHLTHPMPDAREMNPAIPLEAVEVIYKATAKEAEDRYSSANDFSTALG